MLIIEYLNLLSEGRWQKKLIRLKWSQYLLAMLLGLIPGCLGSFAAVALYSHRIFTIGALVTTMIITSGDEGFIMMALIPREMVLISFILVIIGIGAGFITDQIFIRHFNGLQMCCQGFETEKHSIINSILPKGQILHQWRHCIPARGLLTTALALLILLNLTGRIGYEEWNWVKITTLVLSAISLWIVFTVSDHFLEEHLWRHLALSHVPKIFLLTFGALLLIHFGTEHLNIQEAIQGAKGITLFIAAMVGVIPESGPHLLFVTLYSKGALPFSVLLANTIVQDGHGMLPLLASSKKCFVIIKLINLLVGLLTGVVLMMLGY